MRGPDVAERGADDIQREIEQARVKLAGAVDQIAYRTSPKRMAENIKQSSSSAPDRRRDAPSSGSGGLVVILIVRRVRKGRR